MNAHETVEARDYIRVLLNEIRKRGYSINVNCDGENFYPGDNVKKALNMVYDLDECWINAIEDHNGKSCASFFIILQSFDSIHELISDYGINPIAEGIIETLNKKFKE